MSGGVNDGPNAMRNSDDGEEYMHARIGLESIFQFHY